MALAGYKDMENPEMAPEDIAMDFMRGLDNARYSEFMANLLNDLLVPGTKAPETLNAMYTGAAAYILPRNISRNGKGAVFATRADDLRDTGRGRGDRGSGGRGRGGRGSTIITLASPASGCLSFHISYMFSLQQIMSSIKLIPRHIFLFFSGTGDMTHQQVL
jgi:hypothetical protein